MNIQWVFKNCPISIKYSIRSYWQKKQNRIERLVSEFSPRVSKIRITFFTHPNRVNKFEARAVVDIHNRALAVQSSEVLVYAALDKLADRIAAAIRKYKTLVKETFKRQRKKRNDSGISSTPRRLDEHEDYIKKDFFLTLNPFMPLLEKQAKRELDFLELECGLSTTYISPKEIVDDVVLLAWENFDIRPTDIPMQQWLSCILKGRLKSIQSDLSNYVSLDREVKVYEVESKTNQDWIMDVLGCVENFTLTDFIADDETVEVWLNSRNEVEILNKKTI